MRYSIYRFGFATLFYAVLFLTTAEEVSSNQKSNEFDEYVYYQGVQGRPGIDFPVFARIPRTGFSCKQVPSGYYADLETDCQVFHICNEGSKISFLCPNGTIFQQSDLICEWWFKVNCTNSPNLYEESAEQLLEESWRRKENRRPGYQNRLANEEKEKKKNFVVNNQGKRKNLDQNEQSQNRGNRKYKRPINLKGKNDLNLEDSSEESQVLAETASFYDNNGNNNNQNVIHGTEKIGVGRKQKINRGRNQNLNQPNSNDQNLSYNGRKFNKGDQNSRNLNQNGRKLNQNGQKLNQNGRKFNQDDQKEVKLNQNDQNLNYNGRKFNQPSSNDQNGRNFNQNGQILSENDQNLNHNGRKFNQPGSNDQNGRNLNENGRNFKQSDQSEVKLNQNAQILSQNGRNLNQNGRKFNQDDQSEVKLNQNDQNLNYNGRKLNHPGSNDQNGRNLNQNGRSLNEDGQREVKINQNGQILSQNDQNLNHNGRKFNQPSSNDQNGRNFNQGDQSEVKLNQNVQILSQNGRNLNQNGRNLNQNGRNFNQDGQREVKINQNGKILSQNDQNLNHNGRNFNQPSSNDQNGRNLNENGRNFNEGDQMEVKPNQNDQILNQNDQNLNHNGRKFNQPGSNDQNGRNLNQYGRNFKQGDQREAKHNQNGQILTQNDQNLNQNGRNFNQDDQREAKHNQNGQILTQNDQDLNRNGKNFNQISSNNQNGRNLNQNGQNLNPGDQSEVKLNQNGQILSQHDQNGRNLNRNGRKFNQGEQKVNLSQNGRNLNHNGRNFNQPSSNDENGQKLNQNFNQDGQNDQHFNENGRNLFQPNSNDQNSQNLNQNGRKFNQDDQSEVELNQNGRDLSQNGKNFNQNVQSGSKLIENGQNLNQDGSNFYQSNPNLNQNDANLKSNLYNHNLNHDSNQNVHLNTEIDDVLSKKLEKSKINTQNNHFINQENDQNRPQYRNHKTTEELNNNPTVTFTRSETLQYFDEFTTESIQKSTNYNLNNEFITTEYNQDFSTNQFTTNKPFETTQNDQNQYQDQRKEESLTTKEFYPNHKEVYTEVREPKFLSTKAYTTGTQTIPPQTVSTNRIPLNDGKPFVVSTPKYSYNIKEFTTENFFYSPTIPPFTTTTKNFLFNQNTLSNSNKEKDEEEITVSEPYSNVVTENVNQNKINLRFGEENEKIHVVNSIPVITESANKTEFVRISSSLPQKEKPDRIKINVSTNLQKPDNQNPSSESSPIVYRRYSAAISQAENPNNACLDEIVNRKGTTKAPKMTKAPKTTKKPDFEVVVGRKRTENDSKVFKISKYPDIQKPRSFEKATESSIYRVNVKNQEIERVTENNFSLKPTGFYVTKSYNDNQEGTTRFGAGNTYLPKSTTPNSNSSSNRKKSKSLLIKSNDEDFNVNDFDIIQKPKPFELPPKLISNFSTKSNLITSPNYEISSARPFETTITPTQPTIFPPRTPKVYEHVTNMLTSIKDLIKLNKNDTDEESREGLIVPPSAGPQTLHSLAVYFANALEGVENFSQNDDEVTTEQIEEENKSKDIELLSIPTLNRYKDLFKEDDETTQSVTEDNDLEGQHTKNGVVTPRVRQLAQVFTKALSSYLDDPEMFRKYLQDVRPTEPTIKENFRTTQRSVDNTEEDELLNYSDADIKPELPKLSTTTPAISPTWGYLLAKNNSNNFEYNSLSTDGENLQSADSQSFVSQFNNYIKEKHFAPNTTPLSNKDNLFKDKLYSNPLAINDDLDGTKSKEINYELRTLPKIELNSTQVHGILIDFMNTTTDENSRLNRILSKLNTTQDEFLSKMREIEQNPLTRRLILLLISECAGNVTDHNDGDVSKLDLFDSSRLAENDKHVSKNSAIPKFVDQTLKDEDEDTRALELLNSLYTIASRYGK